MRSKPVLSFNYNKNTKNLRGELRQKIAFKPPVASAATHSKAVDLVLLNHCYFVVIFCCSYCLWGLCLVLVLLCSNPCPF